MRTRKKGVGESEVTKRRNRKEVGKGKKNRERVEWQAYTNRLIFSLPLKAYPLLKIKDSIGYKPFRPILSKWIIFIAGPSYEVIHIEDVVSSLVLVP